jgi:Arc/MetJ family transcription regulator
MGLTGFYRRAEFVQMRSEIAGLDVYIRLRHDIRAREANRMAVRTTSIRLDTDLANEAMKVFGVKSGSEAVHLALREIVALKRFKNLMQNHRGKLSFAGHDK